MEGYDGSAGDNPTARGLPHDRAVGVHRLADYRGPNALRLASASSRDGVPIRIGVPAGRYRAIRFLVSGQNGLSNAPVTFEYADGTRTGGKVRCPDWFHDIDRERSLVRLLGGVYDPPSSARITARLAGPTALEETLHVPDVLRVLVQRRADGLEHARVIDGVVLVDQAVAKSGRGGDGGRERRGEDTELGESEKAREEVVGGRPALTDQYV